MRQSWMMLGLAGALLTSACRKDLQEDPNNPIPDSNQPLRVEPNGITETGWKLNSLTLFCNTLGNEFTDIIEANTMPGAVGYDVEMIFSRGGNDDLLRVSGRTADAADIQTINSFPTTQHPVHASITLEGISFQDESSPVNHFATVGNSTIQNAGNQAFYYLTNASTGQFNSPISEMQFNATTATVLQVLSLNQNGQYETPFNSNALIEQFLDNANGGNRFIYITGFSVPCFSNNPAVITNGENYSYRLDRVSEDPLQFSCSEMYFTP